MTNTPTPPQARPYTVEEFKKALADFNELIEDASPEIIVYTNNPKEKIPALRVWDVIPARSIEILKQAAEAELARMSEPGVVDLTKAAEDMAEAAYHYIHVCPPIDQMVAAAWADFCLKRDRYFAAKKG